jgi:Ribbon-helix-helix protein, copG family
MTPKKSPTYVPFNALLSPEMHRELRQRALDTGMSASEIVRDALQTYLAKKPKRRAKP